MKNKTATHMAILQVLVRGPAYGLEVSERIKDSSKEEMNVFDGSLYPALKKLEREGLLKSYKGERTPERGGRPRRYYALTAEGAKEAIRDRTTWAGIFGLLPQGM